MKRSALMVSLGLASLSLYSGIGTADVFRDVIADSGIPFRHRSAPEKKYILESMAGGLAILDFNNDGLMDIYLVNALTVETAYQPESAPSALYFLAVS